MRRLVIVLLLTVACSAPTTPNEARTGLRVRPSNSTIVVGQSVSLNATTVDALGDSIGVATVTWVSSKPSVASVSDAGVATGLAAGVTTVIATTSKGAKDSATDGTMAAILVAPERDGAPAGAGENPGSRHVLDALNFFMADVQTGVGPYLAVFLRAVRHYGPGQVGMVMAAGAVAQVALQTPLGALIDRSAAKRVLIAVAAGMTGVGAVMIALFSPVWAGAASQLLIGGTGALFPPAVAALSLGIVGWTALTARTEAFNHAGNVVAAIGFGLVGVAIGPRAIFWCVVGLAVAAAISALAIRERDIDHVRARGGDDGPRRLPTGARSLARDRRHLVFVVAVVLFHAANAAMLPLVGQALAGDDDHGAPLYMSAVIMLDGVGAGIFGVVSVLVIAELTRGTGRFNLAQGVVATSIGIGAALSNLGAGALAKHAGFPAAFLAASRSRHSSSTSRAECGATRYLTSWRWLRPPTSGRWGRSPEIRRI
jgi:MFS family permease